MIWKTAGMAALWLALTAVAPVNAGTPEQQSACRSDVRRFCHNVPAQGGDDAYLACLQSHRAKLSASCRHMLESNGV